MTKAWNTKYGPRRVKYDPPTLREAIFAATGLTDQLQEQVEIAAALMGLPEDRVRAELMKSRHSTVRLMPVNSIDRGAQRAVVVERRVIRRQVAAR
jgi:hypothetical protein